MEQDPQRQEITPIGSTFKVFWHQNILEDFEKISRGIADQIINAVENRLSQAPQYIGQPLRGTTSRLWKIRYSKYRIIYTIKNKEVWVISVMKREVVYEDAHVQSLLQMALAIQSKSNPSA